MYFPWAELNELMLAHVNCQLITQLINALPVFVVSFGAQN